MRKPITSTSLVPFPSKSSTVKPWVSSFFYLPSFSFSISLFVSLHLGECNFLVFVHCCQCLWSLIFSRVCVLISPRCSIRNSPSITGILSSHWFVFLKWRLCKLFNVDNLFGVFILPVCWWDLLRFLLSPLRPLKFLLRTMSLAQPSLIILR